MSNSIAAKSLSAPRQSEPVPKQISSVGQIPWNATSFLLYLASAVAANGALLWFFHNRFWYATDEGNYAHVAQRVLGGEVLNLHVQDIHPGYINFVNAAAFRVFGLELLSLRYPLVAIALAQAILIFLLFYRSGRKKLAVVAAIAINALGVVHYLNPTSNWYSLFLTVLIICSLEWLPREAKTRLIVTGFFVGTLVLFRQLSGVLVCISVIVYLLLEARSSTANVSSRDLVLARLLILIMGLGLSAYLFQATDVLGIALFGSCPLLILFWLFARTTTDNRQILKTIGSLAAGGMIACLPLFAYHLFHGSMSTWFNDTVLSAIGLTKLNFMDQRLYRLLMFAGGRRLFNPSSFGEVLNGLYWVALPSLAVVNGSLLLRNLIRNRKRGDTHLSGVTYALPVIAVFYGIVSIHYQIPIYLYYTAGFSLAGILWLLPFKRGIQYSALAISVVFMGTAVYYHAGQPLIGKLNDVLGGHRTITSLNQRTSSLARVGLKIEPEQDRSYAEVLRVIESETRPSDTILAVPSNAELYFLSDRKNPFRFFNTALGIRNDLDFQHVKETIISQPPRLVLYREDDKYNTDYSVEIMNLVKERYDYLGETEGFAIYRSR